MNEISEKKSEVMAEIKKLYYIIDEYADERNLTITKRFLPEVDRLLMERSQKGYSVVKDAYIYYAYAVRVCKLLIDLELPVNNGDMDIILTGALGNIVNEAVSFPGKEKELAAEFDLNDEIMHIVDVLTHRKMSGKKEEERYYEEIKKDKFALMIKIVEIAITTEEIYNNSFKVIDEYVRLMREYFFPMCIYAKEKYNDMELAISVVMEKVKLLSDVTEILTRRYRDRWRALVDEMLVLQEENARLRVSIRQMEEEKNSRITE
jgi:hypothetical protein